MAETLEQEQLLNFYTDLRERVRSATETGEEGGVLEENFTEIVLNEYLAESGDTENARACADIRESSNGQRLHKINGYALSDNHENLDLFISVYRGFDEPQRLGSADVTLAFNQCRKFLNSAIKGHWEEMDESAPAYDLARELAHHRLDLVRANLFLLTDAECSVSVPEGDHLAKTDLLLTYRIIDLNYLYRLEGGGHHPIEIDFEADHGGLIPCLAVPGNQETYQSYLAVVPGEVLAAVYEKYGSRLLEMNVRAFLQSTGKVNGGIRRTILDEPEMFLAFNNGIAATAEAVELVDLPGGGKALKAVRELQIVNGGQTTASLFHTQRKDKAPIDRVFVPMKLSVIKNREKVSEIVNRISRYANSQNKVSDADLSANAPFHIQMERLSRTVWAPPQTNQPHQTRWFYERARGQFKNALGKEPTKKRKEGFLAQNPKAQFFAKEDLAKFVNVWSQMPWIVVRGNQKNYAEFVSSLKKKELKPDNVFFEDAIAKAILFRTAEKVYGVKPNAIGDLRYVTVPYSLAWLSHVLAGRLDLYAIWKRQILSEALKTLLHALMVKLETALKTQAPGSLYGEWAKKEECWEFIRKQSFLNVSELATIQSNLTDPKKPGPRRILTDADTGQAELTAQAERLRSVPAVVWGKIEAWGTASGLFTDHQRTVLFSLAQAVQNKRTFHENELRNGPELLDIALDEAPELFEGINEAEALPSASAENGQDPEITLDLIGRMVAWDKKNKKLVPHHYLLLKHIAEGKTVLSEQNKRYVRTSLERLKKHHFSTD